MAEQAEDDRHARAELGTLNLPVYGSVNDSDSVLSEEQPHISQRMTSINSVVHMRGATPLMKLEETMSLPPEDSVYSYLLFMPPIEQRRSGRYVTSLMIFAVVLVCVNFVMQAGLLYVVGQHIMRKHNEWVSSIGNLKHHAWYHVLPMPYNLPEPKCQSKDSPLCFQHGDGISCSPLSVHVLDNWVRLDTDGDGIWTREEAQDEKLRENIQCEYNVDLPTMYDTIVTQINGSRVLEGSRDTTLLAGTGVHKAYLDWYMHKPLLCQYGDQDMCGALFERGFFNEALRQQTLDEFNNTASALKYCNDILQYECFDILPNTYRVWRLVANQQCGDKFIGQNLYRSPADKDTVFPMLSVDFRKRREYASTKDPPFRAFLGILLTTFLCVMALEMRGIIKQMIWCAKFPADRVSDRQDSPEDRRRIVGRQAVTINKRRASLMSTDEDDEGKNKISAVRSDHRCVVFVVTFLRLLLWGFLLWSGIMFLTGPPRYLTMIFDALSLVFIFEIDELLYRTMLRNDFKNDHLKHTEDMQVPQWHKGVVPRGYLTGEMMVMGDAFGFLLVIAMSLAIVYTYTQNELNPILDRLECLCSVQGPQCYEANHYSKAWWDTYWSTTLPASKAIIDELRLV